MTASVDSCSHPHFDVRWHNDVDEVDSDRRTMRYALKCSDCGASYMPERAILDGYAVVVEYVVMTSHLVPGPDAPV